MPGSADEIAELFRGAIRSGHLGDGERLPTVRQTARDFAVAQATVAKAYKVLERDGLVISRTAAGTRVAPGASKAPQAVIEKIRTLVEASDTAGVSLDDVIAILRTIWTAPAEAKKHDGQKQPLPNPQAADSALPRSLR